jgi:hypothetical protein
MSLSNVCIPGAVWAEAEVETETSQESSRIRDVETPLFVPVEKVSPVAKPAAVVNAEKKGVGTIVS